MNSMQTVLTITGILFLGLLNGTITNYLADVLPLIRRLGGAICVHCQRPLSWVGFLFLRDCPHCQKARAWRSRVVMVGMPILYLVLWFFPIQRLNFWMEVVIALYFSLVIIMDLEYRVVLHSVSVAGLLIGLVIGFILHGSRDTLVGGATGFGIMLILYLFGQSFVHWMGHWRGEEIEETPLGFGDVNLGGVLGLMLGWPGITAGLLLAILLGGAFSALFLLFSRILGRYQPYMAIPYAPFLILGAAILLFRP